MDLNVARVPTEENVFSPLSTNSDWVDMRFSKENLGHRIYFNLYLTLPSAEIVRGDWVLLTNYEDGVTVTEKCKSVQQSGELYIFCGESGSRWRLQDAKKIIASSDESLNGTLNINIKFLMEYVQCDGEIKEVTIKCVNNIIDVNMHNELNILCYNNATSTYQESDDLPF